MAINIQNSDIASMYARNDDVEAVYLGEELVWPTIDYSQIPLTFEIVSGGDITVGWRNTLYPPTYDLFYQINDGEWNVFHYLASSSIKQYTITGLNEGDIVAFKGEKNFRTGYSEGFFSFQGSTAFFKAYGNPIFLYDENYSGGTQPEYFFPHLFQGCDTLVDVSGLYLEAPEEHGYYQMFMYCTRLTRVTCLPKNVTTQNYGYGDMFKSCTSLNYLECIGNVFPNQPGVITGGWLDGVAATGTFVKKTTDNYQNLSIPENWTIVNIN